tara:strand:- start:348 stop:566 length:219 start_codon:yes stop_codon:yes gene_type:complete
MNIDLKEYISGREDLFTATNVVEMEECLTKFLEWHKAAISVTRCSTELSKRPNTSSTWECFSKEDKLKKGNV